MKIVQSHVLHFHLIVLIWQGLQDGSIRLWNLKKATKGNHIPNLPFYTIYPISLKSRFAQNVQGHVINTKIVYFICWRI